MKILVVNTFDVQGGAARATYRLHESLLKQNIDSKMLVQYKGSNSSFVISKYKAQKLINIVRMVLDNIPVLLYRHRIKIIFSPSWLYSNSVINTINTINPDIVHLHWICGGMIKIEDLVKIKAPIVWTLHDNWTFTGGCHMMWDCKKYQSKCDACPILHSDSKNDLSSRIFNRKEKTFLKINKLTIVGLSKWLTECSKKSALLKNKKHINLPNPIDTTIFKKVDKFKSRKLLNLPQDKQIVLFGAMSATSDINKGFLKLYEALQKLRSDDIELVVFGNKEKKQNINFGFKTHYLGQINDDKKLVQLYSVADVMIVPSLQENLSNAIMESMSCSTPVVGFDIGGNSDMIEHKKNGYLAKPFDAGDLASGIEWILYNEKYDELCKNAREKVVKNFDSKIVAKRYIALYEDILSK